MIFHTGLPTIKMYFLALKYHRKSNLFEMTSFFLELGQYVKKVQYAKIGLSLK
jgi:hypothetical protein